MMLDIKWNPSKRELRQFAAIWFPALCGVIGWLAFRRIGSPVLAASIWGVGFVVSVTGFVVPALMRPIFIGLSCATYPIGWVVSHVLMAAVFYLLVTPVGITMRLLGRHPLARGFDRSAGTYWAARNRGAKPAEYFRQF